MHEHDASDGSPRMASRGRRISRHLGFAVPPSPGGASSLARAMNSPPASGPTDMTAPAVEADGLVKHFPSKTGLVEAVRGVDLRVEAGEVFGFLGPNGAGKSTTVKMLTTLMSITSGSARVAGVDV